MVCRLQSIFYKVSEWTWKRRKLALEIGMPFSEETVTESVLLDIAYHAKGEIIIAPFNKYHEGKIGADWEWCFCSYTSHGSEEYLTMLVQAKILCDRQEEYSHLFRRIGNSGERQIDRLIDISRKRKSIPLYAFYNYIEDEKRIPDRCGSFSDPSIWGCSAALAEHVRAAKTKKFDRIKKFSFPWVCMLCPYKIGCDPKEGASSIIYKNIKYNKNAFYKYYDIDECPEKEGGPFPKGPSEKPPAYFYDLVEIPFVKDRKKRSRIIQNVADKNPDIDGVIIYRQHKKGEE